MRNWIKCRICSTVVESKYRHDYQACKCGRNFIDGGRDYTRYGGEDFGDGLKLTEVDVSQKEEV